MRWMRKIIGNFGVMKMADNSKAQDKPTQDAVTEDEFFDLCQVYYAKFDDVFPIMMLRPISLEEAVTMMKEAIAQGKPIEIPEKDDPDILF